MTALSIIALCIFIFGAYVYGAVVLLSLRHRTTVWTPSPYAGVTPQSTDKLSLVMFTTCTIWFLLQAVIEFRNLLGQPRDSTWVDVLALVVVFAFPGLIFQTVLVESTADPDRTQPPARLWSGVTVFLYATGAAMAIYFPALFYGLLPGPEPISPVLGFSTGLLFTVCSICSIAVMSGRKRPAASRDRQRLRTAMNGLFVLMIVVFVVLSLMRDRDLLMHVMQIGTRTLPLVFLIVSVYFESRIEFYDLVIKRGVMLLLTLLIGGATFAMTLGWLDRMPDTAARPWLFAVVLLPVAMFMPWLHDRVGRLLDRLWFGREFTPVQAVKHVLSAMQQATDEVSLVATTEATLSEMFRTRIVIVLEDQPIPDTGTVLVDVRTPASAANTIKLVAINEPGSRILLSEDHAMLRSLGGVFRFMLENVRLQRKRLEHEQVTQELRLQTSRSELKALRAQINPHFLFNALNAIASLIHTDPTRADLAVEQLAEVFRYTLRRSDSEWAPLDQELAFARAYLDVEQARFGKRLTFAIDADGETQRARVPSMLLHTLVENAVKHGISRLRQPGRIHVRASASNGLLTLEVRDTGHGPEKPLQQQRTGGGEYFGLRSVRDRLHGYFGGKASLELVRDEARGETVARITMPLTSAELSEAHA